MLPTKSARRLQRNRETSMFRISLLVIAMIMLSHFSGDTGGIFAYKDYFIALLLSILIKPWLSDQFD